MDEKTKQALRREILSRIIQGLSGERDLDVWVEGSPLVEVELDYEEKPRCN